MPVPAARCTYQKFGRMASEYLAFLLTSFPGLETETNPQKPRRGAFNIRYSNPIHIISVNCILQYTPPQYHMG